MSARQFSKKHIPVIYKAIAAKIPAPTTAKPGRNLSAPAVLAGAGDDVVVGTAVVVGAAVVVGFAVVVTMDDGMDDTTDDAPDGYGIDTYDDPPVGLGVEEDVGIEEAIDDPDAEPDGYMIET